MLFLAVFVGLAENQRETCGSSAGKTIHEIDVV